MSDFKLGSLEASEALIRDLYIDLRRKVNKWATLTCQTPQARMGYIGQHLVSIVTSYPGGKSGARGYDLMMGGLAYGEIKTCYRVDQLGVCKDCHTVVSSLEEICSSCGSSNIERRNDSKWLISLRNEAELAKVIAPDRYYFALFEFDERMKSPDQDIIASIWEVDPKTKGFAFCMLDYYLNIRANSKSKAPFNMWPHDFKFLLTEPTLIYRSIIHPDDRIETTIFPSLGNSEKDELKPLTEYGPTRTVTIEIIQKMIRRFAPEVKKKYTSKKDCLKALEEIRREKRISNDVLCDAFAEEVYLPLIKTHKKRIPESFKNIFKELL